MEGGKPLDVGGRIPRTRDTWIALGFTEGDAYVWSGLGIHDAADAEAWRRANYAPWQAAFLEAVLAYEAHPATNPTAIRAERERLVDPVPLWQTNGPPAWWACLCVAAGVLTVRESCDRFHARDSVPDAVDELLRHARQRGLNPWRLTPHRQPRRLRWRFARPWRDQRWR